MKIKDLQIKKKITFQDKVKAIEFIAGTYFSEDEKTGEVTYTPYYTEMAQVTAIVNNFITGVNFTKQESIYDKVLETKKLKDLVEKFYLADTDDEAYNKEFNEVNAETIGIFGFVMNCVLDKVAFRKSEELARVQTMANMVLTQKVLEVLEKEHESLDLEAQKHKKEIKLMEENTRFLEYYNATSEHLSPEENAAITRKMAEMNFDPTAIGETMVEKYLNSDRFSQNEELRQVIQDNRAKDRQIEELQREYIKEKQKDDVGNVLAFPDKDGE